MLRLDSNFFHQDPRFSSKIESFRSTKLIIKNVRVANNNAVRGLAFVQSFIHFFFLFLTTTTIANAR